MDKYDSLWLLFLSTTLIDLTMWLLWKMFTFHCCKIGQHLPKKRSISKRFYSGYLRRITVSDLFVMIYFSGRKSPNIDQLYFDFLVKRNHHLFVKAADNLGKNLFMRNCSCLCELPFEGVWSFFKRPYQIFLWLVGFWTNLIH